jgi:hypothetical protein
VLLSTARQRLFNVHKGDDSHSAKDAVAGGLPVKGRLHALRSGNLNVRARQVDGVHSESRARARGQDAGKLNLTRI